MARLLVSPESPRDLAGAPQFGLAGWIATAPFEDLLGMRIEQAAAGQAVLSMPFLVKHAQGGGVMHGGALTSLADTAVAMAIKSLLPEGTIFATTELKMEFFAPAREGRVVAEAQVRGPEGRQFFGEALLRDEQGEPLARFSSVFRLARGQQL